MRKTAPLFQLCPATAGAPPARVSSCDRRPDVLADKAAVTLIGDAIHAMSPVLAMGTDTAARDAGELTRALSDAAGQDTAVNCQTWLPAADADCWVRPVLSVREAALSSRPLLRADTTGALTATGRTSVTITRVRFLGRAASPLNTAASFPHVAVALSRSTDVRISDCDVAN